MLGRIPGKWKVIFVYLVLLVLSAKFPFFSSIERFAKGTPVQVPAFDLVGDKVVQTERKIPLRAHLHGVDGQQAEAQLGPLPRFRPTVVVYLHRVPWDDQGSRLCEALAKNPRVSVIEAFLPGFHTSSGDVPSHSMETNAAVVAALVEHYGIKEYHVVGQGLGGVAALELTRAYPGRVRSLSLVSAPGAQEFEMMGNPLVNKLVYGFHGAFFWGVSRLTPNFGAADLLPWDRDYAKTVFDTDLSDSKKALREWRKPLYLLHGEDDWVTAVDTARYTAQLVPQARLDVVPGGRDAAFADVGATAAKLDAFMLAAEQAPAAPSAAPAADPPVPTAQGARYWILMLIIVLCCLVAEDPTCLATGLLVGMGLIDFWSGAMACTVSIFIGDVALYSIGRFFGKQALTRAPLKWLLKPHQLDQWAGWFSTPRGMFVVVSSRFVPASRVPTFITAGILRLSPLRLGMLLFLAALVWTPVLMLIGLRWGPVIIEKLNEYHRIAGWIVVGMLLLLYFSTHWLLPALTWRGRRQLVMKVRNLLQPSLWPAAILYLPVRLGVLYHSIRCRSLTAFASANPAFGRIGGFIGDAKSLLLRPFQRDSRCCPTLALAQEDKIEERLKEALWRRNPGQDDGRIMALVQKQDVVVRGDGEQTLEELIWLDEVAVSRGELYQRCHSRELNNVVPAGRFVTLNLTGSYGHGARCVHRPDLSTPELGAAVTAFTKRFPGLHFARFDLRAVSEAELMAGRFTCTEVGGCCHVSSLVRDGSLRFSRSYAAVWHQLKACVEAGRYNLNQNVRPVPLEELMARWSQARGRADEYAVSEE